jgi:hypothetical protein
MMLNMLFMGCIKAWFLHIHRIRVDAVKDLKEVFSSLFSQVFGECKYADLSLIRQVNLKIALRFQRSCHRKSSHFSPIKRKS